MPGEKVILFGRVVDAKGKGRSKDMHVKLEIALYPTVAGQYPVALGYFQNEDTAKRVAKAYIHAMVLCSAAAKPSLF